MNHVFVVLERVCVGGCCGEFFNKELHWFCGKRIFIEGGIYMRLNEVADSNVASSLPI